jgi:hypothetical protein
VSALPVVAALGDRVTVVVEVARLRDHPLGRRIDPILPFRSSLSRAGIDPATEIDRILLAEEGIARPRGALALWQHHIDDGRIQRFLSDASDTSDPERGRTVSIGAFTCKELHRRGLSGTACPLSATLLLVAFHPTPDLLEKLAGSSGIPEPPPGEAVHASFVEPGSSLAFGPFVPPRTLGTAELGFVARPDGGLDLALDAPSESPGADAAAFEAMVKNAVASVKIGPLSLPPPPVHFSPTASGIHGELQVTPDDLDVVVTALSYAAAL